MVTDLLHRQTRTPGGGEIGTRRASTTAFTPGSPARVLGRVGHRTEGSRGATVWRGETRKFPANTRGHGPDAD